VALACRKQIHRSILILPLLVLFVAVAWKNSSSAQNTRFAPGSTDINTTYYSYKN
jgi:hypothetical protein